MVLLAVSSAIHFILHVQPAMMTHVHLTLHFFAMQQTANGNYNTVVDVIHIIHNTKTTPSLSFECVSMELWHLSPGIDTFIIHHLNEHVPSSTITKLVLQTYGRVITDKSIHR